jgi:hypothetical protein
MSHIETYEIVYAESHTDLNTKVTNRIRIGYELAGELKIMYIPGTYDQYQYSGKLCFYQPMILLKNRNTYDFIKG